MSKLALDLTLQQLVNDHLFQAAVAAAEEFYHPDDTYWDGNLAFSRQQAIKKIRRQLEDRIRKDNQALLRAYEACFNN